MICDQRRRIETMCDVFSPQVFSTQNQMCDMMKEIDKERDLCEAQAENKTTGMMCSCVSLLILFDPNLLNPQVLSDPSGKQTPVTTNPALWLHTAPCAFVSHQIGAPLHMFLGSLSKQASLLTKLDPYCLETRFKQVLQGNTLNCFVVSI